jgi:hypothetical protein
MTDSGGNITTMSDQEYKDGYEAEHPELIPGNRTEAHLRVSVALSESLEKCSKETFLRGWWAFCWLNPGFHPDDFRQWDDANGQHFATEAFRRCEAGEIEDDLVYAAEATHNAVWLERRGDPSASLAFKDGYTPQYPELIPANEAEAESRLNAIQVGDIQQCPKDNFLEGWWALFWLNPELNPNYFDEWESESRRTLAEEAFRRFETGEINDQEAYPCEACHSRILGEKATGRTTFGREPFDRRVVIRTDDGQYISRDSGATPDKAKAARYYMIADRVADQIAVVKKLYGRIMTTEDGKWL